MKNPNPVSDRYTLSTTRSLTASRTGCGVAAISFSIFAGAAPPTSEQSRGYMAPIYVWKTQDAILCVALHTLPCHDAMDDRPRVAADHGDIYQQRHKFMGLRKKGILSTQVVLQRTKAAQRRRE